MPPLRLVCLLGLLAPTVYSGADTPKYLVFPTPTDFIPTKVQLILGLGIPMEVVASTIVGYVMKANYNLPFNASVFSYPYYDRFERSAAEKADEDWAWSDEDVLSRYELYKMLESAVNALSRETGKPCLLRAICEAAATPLDTDDSLFAQLLHVLLTPSSTDEAFEEATDQQYRAAESIGLEQADACAHAFRDCGVNALEYLSKIH